MEKEFCFKTVEGTEYHNKVKDFLSTRKRWAIALGKLGEFLGEELTRISQHTDALRIDLDEIKDPANKKLFKKDGTLKQNLKAAKEVQKEFKKIIDECGLTDFEPLGTINFKHGIMRFQGETLDSFATSDLHIYYKANFDLQKRAGDLVEKVSLIEYQEKYLEELKKLEARK